MECPCGSGHDYADCCESYISGRAKASSPEILMRSRYTAFVKRKFLYLTKTQAKEAAVLFDLSGARRDAPFIKWLKLEVLSSEVNEEEKWGLVKFKAHFSFKGHVSVLEEWSRFEKIDGQWFYVARKE